MSLEGLNVSRSPFAASRFHGLSRLFQLENSSGGAGVAVSSRSLVTQLTNRLSTCRLLPRDASNYLSNNLPILRASASKSIEDAADHERLQPDCENLPLSAEAAFGASSEQLERRLSRGVRRDLARCVGARYGLARVMNVTLSNESQSRVPSAVHQGFVEYQAAIGRWSLAFADS